jgi:hypothetical protein
MRLWSADTLLRVWMIGGPLICMVLVDLFWRPIIDPLWSSLIMIGGGTAYIAVLWRKWGPPPWY